MLFVSFQLSLDATESFGEEVLQKSLLALLLITMPKRSRLLNNMQLEPLLMLSKKFPWLLLRIQDSML